MNKLHPSWFKKKKKHLHFTSLAAELSCQRKLVDFFYWLKFVANVLCNCFKDILHGHHACLYIKQSKKEFYKTKIIYLSISMNLDKFRLVWRCNTNKNAS